MHGGQELSRSSGMLLLVCLKSFVQKQRKFIPINDQKKAGLKGISKDCENWPSA